MFGKHLGIAKKVKRAITKKSTAARRALLQIEALEARCVPTATIVDVVGGVPIPAGATLIDSNGKQLLFSSKDPNVVPNQLSYMYGKNGVSQLLWEDASNPNAPVIRMVTSLAGNPNVAPGYLGVGKGVVQSWEDSATGARLSADGQWVVFESRINAHDYDPTVPAANDIADGTSTGDVVGSGSKDVFLWSAAGKDGQNIRAVDLLSPKGRTNIKNQGFVPPGFDVNSPAVIGADTALALANSNVAADLRGIASDGSEVVYASKEVAVDMDTVNTSIADTALTTDAFLAFGAPVGTATMTVSLNKNGDAIGADMFSIESGSFSGNTTLLSSLVGSGQVVVYATNDPAGNIINGDFDQPNTPDIFAFNIAQKKNYLISATTTPNTAVGNNPNVNDLLLVDVSANGNTVSFRCNGNDLVAGYTNTNTSFLQPTVPAPVDFYAYSFSAGKVFLVNTPDGASNTNEFGTPAAPISGGGISGDGSTILFITGASNLAPGAPPPAPTGGYNQLYARNIVTGTTTLISIATDGLSTANADVAAAKLSFTGRFVVFVGTANNLVNGVIASSFPIPITDGPPDKPQIYIRDTVLKKTSLVTTVAGGNVAVGGADDKAFFLNANDSTGTALLTFVDKFISLQRPIQNTVSPPGYIYVSTYPFVAPPGAAGNAFYAAVTGQGQNSVAYKFPIQSGGNVQATPGSPYGLFGGQIRLATGDINGDGTPDYLFGPGPGGGPNIKAIDGKTGAQFYDFMAFSPLFTGGTYVAVADVDGDGYGDMVVGAGQGGGPNVVTYSGKTGKMLESFFAFDGSFAGGVTVAGADFDGDGLADVAAGQATGGSQVSVFLTKSGTTYSFTPFVGFTGGVNIAAGDLNGDNIPDLVVGAGQGGGPSVIAYSGASIIAATPPPTPAVLLNYQAYNQGYFGGVTVAIKDITGTGVFGIVTGSQTFSSNVAVWQPDLGKLTANLVDSFFAYLPDYALGIYVG